MTRQPPPQPLASATPYPPHSRFSPPTAPLPSCTHAHRYTQVFLFLKTSLPESLHAFNPLFYQSLFQPTSSTNVSLARLHTCTRQISAVSPSRSPHPREDTGPSPGVEGPVSPVLLPAPLQKCSGFGGRPGHPSGGSTPRQSPLTLAGPPAVHTAASGGSERAPHAVLMPISVVTSRSLGFWKLYLPGREEPAPEVLLGCGSPQCSGHVLTAKASRNSRA